ncbi:hypothetical protein CEP52_015580 [Fusarium oligoseptatum]|uniref:Uncharacterized protein n=1 Tax=Fusarium oligoseptatum TaxID=2604345 RepID=A0A428SBX6_9HYPO|nr:hypothetical protein CEP52_015580 [Fusarium oligoseptatum]
MENALHAADAPTFLQENVKEFIDTMAYIDMVIKLDKPEDKATEDFQPEDRVLPEVTWKDLVAATITLGTRLNGIIERYTEKENDRKEVVVRAENGYQIGDAYNATTQPRRLNGSDEEYLPWNAAAREFHPDVLGALRRVLLNDHLARTIMENIPIKWTPATDEEALEAAKMAILEADPTLRF